MISTNSMSVRVAVVGAGMMGRNHLRVYSALKWVELIAVIDVDPDRASEAAREFGCNAYGSVDDIVGKVDAVSVCVPSTDHAAVGRYLLDHGIHCLIEKPLATTEQDCLDLIAAAERNGAILLVGHIERFNPAVRQLSAMLEGHGIHAIDVRRLSAVSGRISDVDVVADLMVHDLDIVLSLIGEQPSSVTARGVHTAGGKGQDYVTALLSFPRGGLATLTASRITQNKVRELHVTTDLGLVAINYSTQELMIYRQERIMPADETAASFGNYAVDIAMERVAIRSTEPLVAELQHFIDTIRRNTSPLVTGEQALDALRLVWRIQNEIAGLQTDV